MRDGCIRAGFAASPRRDRGPVRAMDLEDFGTVAAAPPRRRRRAPAWVGSKTPPVGGRWVRLGRRTYYGAPHRSTTPSRWTTSWTTWRTIELFPQPWGP